VSIPASQHTGPLPGLSTQRAFAVLALLIVLVAGWRLAAIAAYDHGLFVDEAQYIDWARDPAFGYYSKPPVLAWSIAAMRASAAPLCVPAAPCSCTDSPFLFWPPAPFDARVG
jgi:hypothetical protein